METENRPAILGDRWYYACNDFRVGPLSLSELRTAIVSSIITHETIVWRNGMTDWTPAKNLPELAAEFDLPPPLPSKSQIDDECATTLIIDSATECNKRLNNPDATGNKIKSACRILDFGGYLVLFLIITISLAITTGVVLTYMSSPHTQEVKDRMAGGMIWIIPGIVATIRLMRQLTKHRCHAVLKSNLSAGRFSLFFKGYGVAAVITMAILITSTFLAAGISPFYDKAFHEASSCAVFFMLSAALFSFPIPLGKKDSFIKKSQISKSPREFNRRIQAASASGGVGLKMAAGV